MSIGPQPAYEGREPYVFVSYSHEDRKDVYSEIARLQEQGVNVWYDTSGIGAGSEWSNALAAAIKGAAHFVYFITPRSVTSEYCRRELNFALEEGCHVIAVHLEKTEVPDGLRLSLNNRQALFRNSDGDYLKKLLRVLERDVAAAPPEPMASSTSTLESDPPSFLVMPVTVVSDDEQLRELALLMSEHLLDRFILMRARIAGGSFTDSDEQAFEAARTSNLRYVVFTSLRSLGDNVSIRARLATASGEQLATSRWRASHDEVAQRIEQFANRTLEELLPTLYRHENDRSKDLPVEALDAWGLVARAAIQMTNAYYPKSETMEMLRRSASLVPDQALPHVWLAIALFRRLEGQRSSDIVRDREEALLHADEAVKLNPFGSGLEIAAVLHSSFGDASLASTFVSRYEASCGTLRSFGILIALINLGRAQEVVDLLEDDPRPEEDQVLGIALQQIGDFEKALMVQQRYFAHAPNLLGPWVQLANTLGHLNRREEALSAWETAKKMEPRLTLEAFENSGWMFPGQDNGRYGGLRRLGLD